MNTVETLSTILKIAVPAFAISSMLSVGLRYPVRQMIEPLRDIPGVISALISNFVLVPLLAYAIVNVLSLDQAYAVGTIIVAAAAGAPLLIKLTMNAKEEVSFAAAILVLLMLVSMVYMPLVIPLLTQGGEIRAWAIARPLILTMFLPLIVGFFGRAFLPAFGKWLTPYLGIIINVSLWTMIILIVVLNYSEVMNVFGTGAILASILLIGGAWIIGYVFGTFDKSDRIVLSFATAQRNFAAASVVAILGFKDPGVLVMTIVISIVALVLIPLSSWFGKRKDKAKQTVPAKI